MHSLRDALLVSCVLLLLPLCSQGTIPADPSLCPLVDKLGFDRLEDLGDVHTPSFADAGQVYNLSQGVWEDFFYTRRYRERPYLLVLGDSETYVYFTSPSNVFTASGHSHRAVMLQFMYTPSPNPVQTILSTDTNYTVYIDAHDRTFPKLCVKAGVKDASNNAAYFDKCVSRLPVRAFRQDDWRLDINLDAGHHKIAALRNGKFAETVFAEDFAMLDPTVTYTFDYHAQSTALIGAQWNPGTPSNFFVGGLAVVITTSCLTNIHGDTQWLETVVSGKVSPAYTYYSPDSTGLYETDPTIPGPATPSGLVFASSSRAEPPSAQVGGAVWTLEVDEDASGWVPISDPHVNVGTLSIEGSINSNVAAVKGEGTDLARARLSARMAPLLFSHQKPPTVALAPLLSGNLQGCLSGRHLHMTHLLTDANPMVMSVPVGTDGNPAMVDFDKLAVLAENTTSNVTAGYGACSGISKLHYTYFAPRVNHLKNQTNQLFLRLPHSAAALARGDVSFLDLGQLGKEVSGFSDVAVVMGWRTGQRGVGVGEFNDGEQFFMAFLAPWINDDHQYHGLSVQIDLGVWDISGVKTLDLTTTLHTDCRGYYRVIREHSQARGLGGGDGQSRPSLDGQIIMASFGSANALTGCVVKFPFTVDYHDPVSTGMTYQLLTDADPEARGAMSVGRSRSRGAIIVPSFAKGNATGHQVGLSGRVARISEGGDVTVIDLEARDSRMVGFRDVVVGHNYAFLAGDDGGVTIVPVWEGLHEDMGHVGFSAVSPLVQILETAGLSSGGRLYMFMSLGPFTIMSGGSDSDLSLITLPDYFDQTYDMGYNDGERS